MAEVFSSMGTIPIDDSPWRQLCGAWVPSAPQMCRWCAQSFRGISGYCSAACMTRAGDVIHLPGLNMEWRTIVSLPEMLEIDPYLQEVWIERYVRQRIVDADKLSLPEWEAEVEALIEETRKLYEGDA